MTTPNLGLAELVANQSQPHVPINQSLRILDALVQVVAIDILTAPPAGTHQDGDTFLVDTGATGLWAGLDEHLVYWQTNAWQFLQPKIGWRCYLASVGQDYRFSAGSPNAWAPIEEGGGGGASRLVDLSDVNTANLNDGFALVWNEADGQFEFVSIAAGGSINITDLADVLPGSPGFRDGDTLVWNESIGKFIPGASGSPSQVYDVSPSGTPYATVNDALTAIAAGSAPTLANPALIRVFPGTYTTTAAMVIPQYVSVVGAVDKTWAAARFINDTTDVFQPAGFNTFQNLTCRQGATRGTYFINVGNNTDISVLGCAMFGLSSGQNQGFFRASGTTFARLTLQHCIMNSFQPGTLLTPGTVPVAATVDTMVLIENTSSAARFCDTWLRDCFFDNYQVVSTANTFAFAVLAIGVQDVRIESGCTFRGSGNFIGCYLAKGNTSGACQLEFRHSYTGGNTIGVSPESGCTINVINSDAAGSVAGSGTIVTKNSYIGAAYNSYPI